MQPTIRERFDITPYCRALDLSSATQIRAESILMDAEQARLTSRKTPQSLIASALYIACILEEERRTLAKISQVTGVSVGTVQRNYAWLVRELGIRRE